MNKSDFPEIPQIPFFIRDVRKLKMDGTLRVELELPEQYSLLGPVLFSLIGEYVNIKISYFEEDRAGLEIKKKEEKNEYAVKLHAEWFKKPLFQNFLKVKSIIYTPEENMDEESEAKWRYKKIYGLESLKDIKEETYKQSIKDFNMYLTKRKEEK